MKFNFVEQEPEQITLPSQEEKGPIKSPFNFEESSLRPLRPTKEELIQLITPLIPQVEDGETPTEEMLLELIARLIPDPIPGKPGRPGKDGSPDTGKQIVAKLNALALTPDQQIDFEHIKNFPWHKLRELVDNGGNHLIAWGNYRFAENETPSGTFDGVNDEFTLAYSPNPTDSLRLYLNGQFLTQGVEYTLSESTITFASAPDAAFSGLPFKAFYRY